MEMIERIARKLCKIDYPDQPQDWHDRAWSQFSEEARAVIAEMREPTEAMIVACWHMEGSQQLIWQRSIDAALRPT